MMKQGCVSCKEPLQLASCVSERKYGLASLFYIKCCKCGDINCVASGKRQNDEKNGQGPFNVNAKLGAGVYKNFIHKLDCIIQQYMNIIFSRCSFNVSYIMHYVCEYFSPITCWGWRSYHCHNICFAKHPMYYPKKHEES